MLVGYRFFLFNPDSEKPPQHCFVTPLGNFAKIKSFKQKENVRMQLYMLDVENGFFNKR